MCVCVCVRVRVRVLCIAMTFSIANNTIKWIYVRHAICIHKILDTPDTEPAPAAAAATAPETMQCGA